MRPYEVMIIFDPTVEESAVHQHVDRSNELIRNDGGTPVRVDRWGKRRLAYEIKHHREGYYVVVEATAEPATMSTLDRSLHLADEVLRHKVIRLPDKVAGKEPRPPAPSAEPLVPAEIASVEASDTSTNANGA